MNNAYFTSASFSLSRYQSIFYVCQLIFHKCRYLTTINGKIQANFSKFLRYIFYPPSQFFILKIKGWHKKGGGGQSGHVLHKLQILLCCVKYVCTDLAPNIYLQIVCGFLRLFLDFFLCLYIFDTCRVQVKFLNLKKTRGYRFGNS